MEKLGRCLPSEDVAPAFLFKESDNLAGFIFKQYCKRYLTFHGRIRIQAVNSEHFDDIVLSDLDFGGHLPYLFDGALQVPPLHNKVVCFVRQGASWLETLRVSELHLIMYYPEWTLEELERAEAIHEKQMGENLKTRFASFGGIPQHCLWPYTSVWDSDLWMTKLTFHSFKSLEVIRTKDDPFCLLLHVVPKRSGSPFASRCTWKFASEEIESLVIQNIRSGYYRWDDLRAAASDETFRDIVDFIFQYIVRSESGFFCEIPVVSLSGPRKEIVPVQDVETHNGAGILGSAWTDDSSLVLFAMSSATQPTADEILSEVRRRSPDDFIPLLKIIWLTLERVPRFNNGEVEISLSGARVEHFYALLDEWKNLHPEIPPQSLDFRILAGLGSHGTMCEMAFY